MCCCGLDRLCRATMHRIILPTMGFLDLTAMRNAWMDGSLNDGWLFGGSKYNSARVQVVGDTKTKGRQKKKCYFFSSSTTNADLHRWRERLGEMWVQQPCFLLAAYWSIRIQQPLSSPANMQWNKHKLSYNNNDKRKRPKRIRTPMNLRFQHPLYKSLVVSIRMQQYNTFVGVSLTASVM